MRPVLFVLCSFEFVFKAAFPLRVLYVCFLCFFVEQIVQAVITMDDEVLDMEVMRSLRQQAPSGEDITALKEFDGDHSKLGKVR